MTLKHDGVRPSDRWRDVARATGLLSPDGTARATIFAEMSALATRTGALNLGQGFPDIDGPDAVKRAAMDAIAGGVNQYPPGPGTLELRAAIAAHQDRHYGLDVNPDTEVLVTAGATEAIAAAVLALAGPGDEVLTLEPFYDSYAAVIALAGATHTTAALLPTPDGFRLDETALRAAFSPRTRIVLVNTPHNPTGAVLTRAELELIARLAVDHDTLVVTDEVYEHLVYDDAVHVPVATLPGMAERTLTISSAGKTFSFTGWKVGWVTGPIDLVHAVESAKQWLTFSNAAPLQPAVAHALTEESSFYEELARDLQTKRDLLCAGLAELEMDVHVPEGTYFVTTDVRRYGYDDGLKFCLALPERAGVVAIPAQVFYDDHDEGRHKVRWAFCKETPVLEEGLRRLQSTDLHA